MATTVADQFAATLAAANVKRAYGIVAKAVMNGRIDGIIDLAKTNIWR